MMPRACPRWTLGCLIALCLARTVAFADDVIDPALAKSEPGDATLWYDIKLLDVEGKGWSETTAFYDRLPAKAEGVVPASVWGLSHHSAGLCARFVTDATTIQARWTLTSERLAMPHMPATGVSGLDLYVRVESGESRAKSEEKCDDRVDALCRSTLDPGLSTSSWRWLGVGQPTKQTNTARLTSGIPAGKREFMLYLPLYNGVTSVEIGIAKENFLAKAPPRPAERSKPIVFYGTSITQGGCASRPGMVHTAILGRRLDRPVINLGFSGSGKMEPAMATLFAELDPAVYVLDCLPNMTVEEVTERVEPFVRTLRKAHAETPIVLVEDRSYANSFLVSSARQRNESSRVALRRAYERLTADGVKNLSYLPGENLLGTDGEDTVDSSHPTDLGFVRQAEAFRAVLGPILRRSHAK